MSSSEITVAVPADANDVAAQQHEAEAQALALKDWTTIDCAEEYQFADEILTAIVRRKDAVVAMRKQATGPLYQAIRTIEGWFKPVVKAHEQAERHVKGLMGSYRVAQEAAEREARDAARAAAIANDSSALVNALTAADTAAAPPPARASTTYYWAVKRVNADLLPREWLVPDMRAIEDAGRAEHGDEPPVIPGVVFERVAKIGARR